VYKSLSLEEGLASDEEWVETKVYIEPTDL